MGYEPNLVAPYKSGLSQYYKPFIIGKDAFVKMLNCYTWRGSVKKREGSVVLGRIPLWGSATAITNATPPVVTLAAHGLLTGDMVYLENVVATNGTITLITPGITTSITTTGPLNISVGNTVYLTGIVGSIGTILNQGTFPIISISGSTIVLSVSTNGLSYSSGGTVELGGLEKQAFYITVINANTFSLQVLNALPPGSQNVVASGQGASADIYLPIVGTRTFLLTSTGNEQLVVFNPKEAWLYNTTSNSFIDISFNTTGAPITWSGTKDNFFYTSNFATVMWSTNNIFNTVAQPVGIRFFNGSTTNGWADFQPMVNSIYLNSALMILPYKGRLVALNTTEGSPQIGNKNFYSRARWSQLGTPFVANAPAGFSNDATAWLDNVPGKGGYIDADTSEQIVACGIVQDTLIVGFQFSMWRLRYTGNEILPFVWERINTQFGIEGTFTTVEFDEGLLGISRRGIIRSTFNDVDRIDLEVPDFVDSFEDGGTVEGIDRIQGIRDYQKRLVYWLYGDTGTNAQTPNNVLCYNYQDSTWAQFQQSFTTLGQYKQTVDSIWSTWTTIWAGDTSTWETPLDQQNTIIIVAGDVSSRVWQIMAPDVSTDNGINYNFVLTTNLINPYFNKAMRCRLQYYDLYTTGTDNCQVTLQNYIDDNSSAPWLQRVVNLSSATDNSKYTRVFLGMIARQHQITITLSAAQLADPLVGSSDFELQGVIFHTRNEGRIKR